MTEENSSLDRRSVLRYLGGGALAGPVFLSGCSGSGPEAPQTVPGDVTVPGRVTDDVTETPLPEGCAATAGGSVTETVDGVDHEISVRGVRVTGTCSDLASFTDRDVIDPRTGPLEFDATSPPHAVDTETIDEWDGPDADAGGQQQIGAGTLGAEQWACPGSGGVGGDAPAATPTIAYTPFAPTVDGMPVHGERLRTEWTGAAPEKGLDWELVDGADANYRLAAPGSELTRHVEVETTDSESDYDREMSVTGIDVDLGLNLVIVLPDWHPSHPVSEACRRRYCRNLRAVFDHERGHARNMARTLHEFQGGFASETLPTVRYNEGADEATVRDVLYREATAMVYERVRRFTCEARRQEQQFHTNHSESLAFPTFCDSCTPCEGYDTGPVEEVDAWRFSVAYFWRTARVSGDESYQERQGYVAEFQLTDRSPHRDGVEWKSESHQDAISWSHYRRNVNDDNVNLQFGSGVGTPLTAPMLSVNSLADGEYLVRWDRPQGRLPYTHIHRAPDHTRQLDREGVELYYGRRAQFENHFDQSFDEFVADRRVSLEAGHYPTWPSEGCSHVLTKTIRQPLRLKHEYADPKRHAVSPTYDGPTVGGEVLLWNLVPVVDTGACRHIDCFQ